MARHGPASGTQLGRAYLSLRIIWGALVHPEDVGL